MFNTQLYGELIDIGIKRGLPMLAGLIIVIIGVAFVLSGTKAGRVAGGVVELVATKGAGKIARAVN